jgi:TfoX/Sxy family transcriptional regulator of competence genes
MSTTPGFITYVHDQAGLGPALSSRRMFGEYALYLDGKVVALVCDDHLYLKPTDAILAVWPNPAQAFPFPGAKPWLLADEWLDDGERLRQLLRLTADALPLPKPKAARKSKRPPGAKTGRPSEGQRRK